MRTTYVSINMYLDYLHLSVCERVCVVSVCGEHVCDIYGSGGGVNVGCLPQVSSPYF